MIKNLLGPGGIRPTIKIAFPLMVSTTTEALMLFIDRLFLKQVSNESMNACMSGGLTVFAFTSFFIGIIAYSTALVAQYFGAGQKTNCSKTLSHTIIFSIVSVPIIWTSFPLAIVLLESVGLDELERQLSKSYLVILMLGSLLDLFRTSLTSFFGGVGRTKVILISTFVMGFTNVGANYVLIFGNFGIPPLGIEGAGYGTLCAWFIGVIILTGCYIKYCRKNDFNLKQILKVDLVIQKKLIRFGFPSGLEITLLIFAIDLVILTFQSYGTAVSTAITVTFTWGQTAHIPMIGLEIGAMSLVGRFLGAGDSNTATQAVFSGLILSTGYALVCISAFLFFTKILVGIFLSKNSLQETMSMAIYCTKFTSFWILFLCWSSVLAGGLRGAGDTYAVMIISIVFWWFEAFLVMIMVYYFELDPVTVFTFFILTIPLYFLFLLFRFRQGTWRNIDVLQTP